LFTETIEANPADPAGYINYGSFLLHISDIEGAQRFVEKASTLDDRAPTACNGSGNWYMEQAIYSKAIENVPYAIELGLEESDVFYMLGIACQQQEQFKLALPYLLRAMELSPKDVEIAFQYGLSLAQCDHIQDAASIFQD